mmetsp:Transcript_87492/g.209289  ORF Transcript_87492/g.209289 Transcript_87492/m.209289 type:complete len:206 (-) Transcript_87492:346-963(-)
MDLSFLDFFCSARFLASAAASFAASEAAGFFAAAFFFFNASSAACLVASSTTFSSSFSFPAPFSSLALAAFGFSSLGLASFGFPSSLAAAGYPPAGASPASSLSFFLRFRFDPEAPPCASAWISIPSSPRMASRSSSSGFTCFLGSFFLAGAASDLASLVSRFSQLSSTTGACSASCSDSDSESEMGGGLAISSSSSEASAHLPV